MFDLQRVLVGVTIVAILGLTILAANVGQVEAQSTIMVTPSSPTAGQSFTLSGNCDDTLCGIIVYLGGACGVSVGLTEVFQTDIGSGPYSVSVSGQPAGSGRASVLPFHGAEVCVNFTVIPAATVPEYPYGLTLLAVLTVLGYAVIKRKTKSPETIHQN